MIKVILQGRFFRGHKVNDAIILVDSDDVPDFPRSLRQLLDEPAIHTMEVDMIETILFRSPEELI